MGKDLGIRVKWLGCAGFEMDFGGFSVVTDPFIDSRWQTETAMQEKVAGPDCGLRAKDVERCDAIAVTHGHYDHVTEVPALQKRFSCPVLCGEMTAWPLMRFADLGPADIRVMSPNLELDYGAVKIKALYGIHTRIASGYRDSCSGHPLSQTAHRHEGRDHFSHRTRR